MKKPVTDTLKRKVTSYPEINNASGKLLKQDSVHLKKK